MDIMTISIYDYAGGAEAMHRLAAAQYAHCLQDPVLNAVFGTTARPEHVDHLADWLGEVFGGPAVYTEQHGGHAGLLKHHAGLDITPEQRRRFVEVFMQAADEAGLPADERFRTRLEEYLDWGSAIAVEISRPGADVSSTDPVPRWDWGAAGPPER